jgi:hypothetical protein
MQIHRTILQVFARVAALSAAPSGLLIDRCVDNHPGYIAVRRLRLARACISKTAIALSLDVFT